MTLNWLDRIGDWNPQLFRELKGRLKSRHLLLTTGLILMGQMLLVLYFYNQLPTLKPWNDILPNFRYCLNPQFNASPPCLPDAAGAVINWQLWSLDLFICLSVVGSFVLLTLGVFLLVTDLDWEERRGTLNFIRLSPQSAAGILIGKLLGVPVLLYVATALTIPLHFWAGLQAELSPALILSFYGVLAASCLFFFSAALLYGLNTTWLGGFQPWLGGGLVFLFLTWVLNTNSISCAGGPIDALRLFSPIIALLYLTASTPTEPLFLPYGLQSFANWEFFNLPIGFGGMGTIGFMLFNYGLWSYWSWQGLKRCFHNSGATLLSKQHSYWLVAGSNVVMLGFALQSGRSGEVQRDCFAFNEPSAFNTWIFNNFQQLLLLNLLLFLGLIAALSPQRQALLDWARYRRELQTERQNERKRSLVWDLLWGEKSPALVAIALNLLIASTILAGWILSWPPESLKLRALAGLILNLSLILLYAAIVQQIGFMNIPKRAFWALGAIGIAIVLPPLVLVALSLRPETASSLWLFSAFHWAAIQYTTATSVFFGLLGQAIALVLLNLQFARQLKQAGESASKPLLASQRT